MYRTKKDNCKKLKQKPLSSHQVCEVHGITYNSKRYHQRHGLIRHLMSSIQRLDRVYNPFLVFQFSAVAAAGFCLPCHVLQNLPEQTFWEYVGGLSRLPSCYQINSIKALNDHLVTLIHLTHHGNLPSLQLNSV